MHFSPVGSLINLAWIDPLPYQNYQHMVTFGEYRSFTRAALAVTGLEMMPKFYVFLLTRLYHHHPTLAQR